MRVLVVALSLALSTAVLSTRAALADGAPADGGAEANFEAGQKLFDAGRLDEARELFLKAYAVSKSPNARLMIARCLTGLGRLGEAHDEMEATLREATARAETDARYVPTRDAAASELALLDRRLGKLTVVIMDFAVGTEVTINGARLPPERIGYPVPVKPGKIIVRVAPPAGAAIDPIEREVTIGPGEVQTVAVSVPRPVAVEKVVVVAPEPTIGPLRGAGIGVATVGVVGMAVFAGAGLASNGKFNSLAQSCSFMRCTNPADASTVDSGKTLDTVANVGLGVGIVGIVGGVAMIVFGGPKKSPVTTTGRTLSVAF